MRLTVVIFLFACAQTFAQYGETIQTGRPGQAIGARTLGAKVFQIQSGLNFNSISGDDLRTSIFANTTVLRLGVFEHLEVSALMNWQADYFSGAMAPSNRTGVSNTQLGLRYNILQNDGFIPTLGIQGRLLLKAQSSAFRRDHLGAIVVLATANKLCDWLSLTTNSGVQWNGDNLGPHYFYVVNFSSNISEKIGLFAEVYGGLNEFDTNFDTGIAYLVHKNLQLDASVGLQGNSEMSDWFVDAGVSWRFDWRRNKSPE